MPTDDIFTSGQYLCRGHAPRYCKRNGVVVRIEPIDAAHPRHNGTMRRTEIECTRRDGCADYAKVGMYIHCTQHLIRLQRHTLA